MKGNPTYIGRTLQTIADLFRSHHIEFAVSGALSLGIRDKPRYTSDIDVLVHPDDYQTVENVFIHVDFTILLHDEYMLTVMDASTSVKVDVLFSPFDPEESARATATCETIFGVNLPVIRSEYLLWMYLLSDQEKHRVDGINLIKSGNINLEKLVQYLQYDGDNESLERLDHWKARAKQEQQSSYSESIKRRSKKRT